MKLAALAALALASAPVAAAPCPENGAPILEIDRAAIPNAHQPTWQTRLYASGGWTTFRVDASGKAATPESGCLEPAALTKVRAALASASWKVTHNRFHCMAMAVTYTVYKVNGKQVWKDILCNPDSLDAQSKKAIDELEAQLKTAKALPAD